MFVEFPTGIAEKEEIASKEAVGAEDDIEWKESTVSVNPQFIESFWSSAQARRTTIQMSSGDTVAVYLDYGEVKRRLENASLGALYNG
jgi:hypothetical protein